MEALRKYKYSLEHKITLLGEEDPSVGWYIYVYIYIV